MAGNNQKTVNFRIIIEDIYDGKFYEISPYESKKSLTTAEDFHIYTPTHKFIIPKDMIQNWNNINGAVLTDEKSSEAIKTVLKEFISPMEIKKNINSVICLTTLMVKYPWDKIINQMKQCIHEYKIRTIDQLILLIDINNKMNFNMVFDMTSMRYVYQSEIFNELIKKFTLIQSISYMKSIKISETPNVRSLFNLKKLPESISYDTNSIKPETHWGEKPSQALSIKTILNPLTIITKYNSNFNNIIDKIGKHLDGHNAVLTGGSLFATIVGRTIKDGQDIDIFCTPAGLQNIIDTLTKHFKSVVIFKHANVCINILVPNTKLLIQCILCQNPIVSIFGDAKHPGFDFEHLKFIISNNNVYCSYGALLSIIRGTTTISADIVGAVQPHRLKKAVENISIEKTPELIEYSSYLLGDEVIVRSLNYLYLGNIQNVYYTANQIRKIYGNKERIVFFENGKFISVYQKHQEPLSNIKMLIDECDFIEKNHSISDKPKLNETIGEKVLTETYEGQLTIQKTTIFNKSSGLLPPCKVIIVNPYYIGKRNDLRSFVVVEPLNRKGPIITNFIGADEIKYIMLNTDSKLKIGQVIYPVIEGKKIPVTFQMNHETFIALKVNATDIIRYSDLDNFEEPKIEPKVERPLSPKPLPLRASECEINMQPLPKGFDATKYPQQGEEETQEKEY